MKQTLESPLTRESRIAKWAHENASSHDQHYIAPTDRVVPVLFTPLVALTVAGAVGCALGPATSFATAFGYHDLEASHPDGMASTRKPVKALLAQHPGMA
ncbi:hypothetical protein RM572_02230 [Streptomyces sp. DSM 42041]|uniref:Uncharacterized protein n=1 Tax=Streptomyces hazeniae TaxID=3075538 RepID=A0ABU2NKU2_9ACTN|nr:hypothetical protein [Streptomyces sp. DSM 42041]MDT0377592.1 hypothetical protein [Streptomyces sp. DSM 42041]